MTQENATSNAKKYLNNLVGYLVNDSFICSDCVHFMLPLGPLFNF